MPKAGAQDEDQQVASPSPTRAALLDAAATAIATSGWSAVTTRQVAALAEVNQGLVHYHFGSMDALRREAALCVLMTETEAPTVALLGAASLPDGVAACLDALRDLDPRGRSSLVLCEAMLTATRDDELAALLAAALHGFRDALAERVAAHGGRTPAASAAAFVAALDGIVLHRAIDPALDPADLTEPLLATLQLPQENP